MDPLFVSLTLVENRCRVIIEVLSPFLGQSFPIEKNPFSFRNYILFALKEHYQDACSMLENLVTEPAEELDAFVQKIVETDSYFITTFFAKLLSRAMALGEEKFFVTNDDLKEINQGLKVMEGVPKPKQPSFEDMDDDIPF